VVTDRIDVELVESSSSSLIDLVGLIGDYRAHFGFPRDPDDVSVWLRDHLGTTQLTAYLAWVSGHYRARAEAAAMAGVRQLLLDLPTSTSETVRARHPL
jgi:hypothetical protein